MLTDSASSSHSPLLDKPPGPVTEPGLGPTFAPAPEAWLDVLAVGLAECGWLSIDAMPVLGPGLLAGLEREVVTLYEGEAMRSAGIGRGQDRIRDRSVRRDRIAWLQGQTAVQNQLFGFFEWLRLGLNQRLFLGLRRFEAHYASYGPGDFYRRHVDSFQGRASRIVSLVLYLNPGWQAADGGALQLFSGEDPQQAGALVLPEAGRLAVFLSEEIPHEVLPAHRPRHSIACWLRQDAGVLPAGIDVFHPGGD